MPSRSSSDRSSLRGHLIMGTRSARNRLGAAGALESRPVGFLGRVRDVTVDADGVTARAPRETVLDVLFDGRRVLSFWLHRDGAGRRRHRRPATSRWRCPGPRPCRSSSTGPPGVTVVVARDRGGGLRRRGDARLRAPGGSRSSTATASRSASTSPGAASSTFDTRSAARHRAAARRHRGRARGARARPGSRPSWPTAPCSARSARASCSATTATPTSATSAATPTRST